MSLAGNFSRQSGEGAFLITNPPERSTGLLCTEVEGGDCCLVTLTPVRRSEGRLTISVLTWSGRWCQMSVGGKGAGGSDDTLDIIFETAKAPYILVSENSSETELYSTTYWSNMSNTLHNGPNLSERSPSSIRQRIPAFIARRNEIKLVWKLGTKAVSRRLSVKVSLSSGVRAKTSTVPYPVIGIVVSPAIK